ncbi:MAG TPA: hypothetical protein VGD90_07415 [Sphingobacteriaceae bacterium]
MNFLKRALGVVWICLGAALVVYFPYKTYSVLMAPASTSEDYVFWIVVTGIFIPVILGLLLFGYYALKGEYDEPPLRVQAFESAEQSKSEGVHS